MNKLEQYREYVSHNALQYRGFLANTCLETERSRTRKRVYNRLLFSFLSVNTSFDVTERAYAAMKNRYHTDWQATMEEFMAHGLHYAGTRAKQLAYTTDKYLADWRAFLRSPHESWNAYRARLVKLIKGLSWIKVSFFITLTYPTADLCCLDRWMLRAIGFEDAETAMRKISRQTAYQATENLLRREARKLRVPMFLYQWAVWDKVRHDYTNAERLFETSKVKVEPMASLNHS